jgi:hypothetical protein
MLKMIWLYSNPFRATLVEMTLPRGASYLLHLIPLRGGLDHDGRALLNRDHDNNGTNHLEYQIVKPYCERDLAKASSNTTNVDASRFLNFSTIEPSSRFAGPV